MSFFFPAGLHPEMATWVSNGVIRRRFYTLRALLWHLWGEITDPFKAVALLMKLQPDFSRRGLIAFDAETDGQGNASYSHTCSGSNRLLVACQMDVNVQGTYAPPTYAGISTTEIVHAREPNDNSDSYMWRLINPPSGSNTFTMTYKQVPVSGIVSFSGADQVQDRTATGSKTGTGHIGDDPSVTIVTTFDRSWVVDGVSITEGANSFTVNVGTPLRNTITEHKNANGRRGCMYSNQQATAGSQLYTMSLSGSQSENARWAYTAMEVKEKVIRRTIVTY